MLHTRILLLTALLSGLAGALAIKNASAQSPDDNTSSELETITVTATRQQKRLRDISASVSQIGGEALARTAHEHINQALVRVPGVWLSRGNGQEHLTAIRSPVLTGAGSCGAFYFAENGISLRAPGFCNVNQLFDVNSEQAGAIEVVRGPASSLYGSNAVHGVINILSPDAFNAPSLMLGLDSGPHDYLRGRFSAATQSEHQAWMVYGNLAHDGGYKSDSGFEQQKINLTHQFQDEYWEIKSLLSISHLNQETAGFVQGQDAYRDPVLRRFNPNPEAFRDSAAVRLSSRISYAPQTNTRLTLTPYLRWTDMTFLQHFLPWRPLEENGQKSFGIKSQFEQQFSNLTLVSGFDLDVTRGELKETQAVDFSPSIPPGVHYDYQVDAQHYSPFLRLDWRFNDQLAADVGVRYEHSEYDYDNLTSGLSACAPEVENCRFTRPQDQTVSFDDVSYQLGVRYQLDNSSMLYAQWANGYRAPQTTELFRLQAGQEVANLDSEQIDNLQFGIRSQWQWLFVDATAFHMQKRNVIFQDTQRQNISNGETEHTGLEILLRADLPENFYFEANATYADHSYRNNLTLSRENIRGNEIDTAPGQLGGARLGWRNDTGRWLELEWVHQGDYYLNPENTAEYEGHNLLNLRAGITFNDAWQLSVRLLNLADRDYAERADFAFGNYRYFVGEPRSLFISVRWQMN